MNKNLRIALIATVITIIGVGGYFGYTTYLSPQEQAEDVQDVQTAVVRQGDIEIVATGVGEVIAAVQYELSFPTSGELIALHVRVGERVEAGTVLAELGNITSLESAVASAELSVLEYELALQALYDNHPLDLARAQLALAQAQNAVNDTNYYYQSAQPGYRGSDADYAATYASYVLALEQLERAENAFDRVSGLSPSDPSHAQALSQLESARENTARYEYLLNWYTGEPSDIEQAELLANIAIAEANVVLAELDLALLVEGPDPNKIALAEARLADAQTDLEEANENLANTTMIAPISGTILVINGQVGETVGSNFITVANIDQPLLEIYLDEADFGKIDLDYLVEIEFDSIPDRLFIGRVIQVNPVLSTSGNVSVVTGLVQLVEEEDFILALPIGSNATVEIYAAQVENAILVPVEALRQIDAETYAVFVIEDGEPVMRIVEVGLIDITYAEVISGLNPGDEVTTGIVETE